MRLKSLQSILAIFLLITTACTPKTGRATEIPGEALNNKGDINSRDRTVTVLAAASLTESFTELGTMFQDNNPGVAIIFNFGGSQLLAEQLNQGAEADVFASASNKYMDAVIESKRVSTKDVQIFTRNRLVVVYPKSNPAELKVLQDLADPGVKLVLADKSVPVGLYSLEFLEKAAIDPGFDSLYQDKVLNNVVSNEDSVKSVLTKVVLGEADAGIVYITDITPAAAEKVGKMEIPDTLNTIAKYPIAPITDSKNGDLAEAFVTLVLSPEGQQVLAKYGFIPVK